jgi:hypothetical protein
MSEQNKKIAIAFYEKLINEFDPEGAFAQYGGESYTGCSTFEAIWVHLRYGPATRSPPS